MKDDFFKNGNFKYNLKLMTERVYPIYRSPPDSRDLVYETSRRGIVMAPPSKLDLRKYLNKPRNQGSRGTCASFASACIKEYHERLDCDFTDYMSPESVYYYRENKPDSGMYLRDAMSILQKYGIATEKDLPYNPMKELDGIEESVIEGAKRFKIASYARIYSKAGLKIALANNGPCIIAFPVYDDSGVEFWREKGESRGGHAVAVVGYNEKGFIIRNSWGYSWNGDGCVLYPYEDWGSHWEIWTAVDENSNYKFPREDTIGEKIKKILTCRT